jgi:hypothetical protein
MTLKGACPDTTGRVELCAAVSFARLQRKSIPVEGSCDDTFIELKCAEPIDCYVAIKKCSNTAGNPRGTTCTGPALLLENQMVLIAALNLTCALSGA